MSKESVIWKYRIPIDQATAIPWPSGAEVVHVAHDLLDPFAANIWIRREKPDPTWQDPTAKFSVVGTGHTFEPYLISVGTAVDSVNSMVWHVMRWPS